MMMFQVTMSEWMELDVVVDERFVTSPICDPLPKSEDKRESQPYLCNNIQE